jgi:hypothetical protein
MHSGERDQDPAATATGSTEEDPALRDASATASRIEADEAAALEVRDRLHAAPLPPVAPDDQIGPHLSDGELVHGLRTRAILKAPGDDRALGYGGTLYLTSRRLLHIGQVTVNVQLTDIVETSLAGERLLITLSDGEGLVLDVDRPRQLRAEIAAAIRAVRP